jgi:sugar/nucleoside kinase (ribokinase family)
MPRIVQDELIPVFAMAQKAGVKTVLDVVVPGPGEYLSHLDRLLPHVDVFLPNIHEAELMTKKSDPVKQAETFRRLGAGMVVITMGSEGAVLVSEKARLRSGVYSVPFVDGSGGGDAFDAGFIYGLLKGMAEEDCLRVASALGASCVRAIGTTPGVFTRSECEEFLKKNTLRIEAI